MIWWTTLSYNPFSNHLFQFSSHKYNILQHPSHSACILFLITIKIYECVINVVEHDLSTSYINAYSMDVRENNTIIQSKSSLTLPGWGVPRIPLLKRLPPPQHPQYWLLHHLQLCYDMPISYDMVFSKNIIV